MKKYILILAMLLSLPAFGQEAGGGRPESAAHARTQEKVVARGSSSFGVSTNLFDWADLGTVNIDLSKSVSRHVTLHLGGKFNAWEFENDKGPVYLTKNNQTCGYFGMRLWPWYVYSGWWVGLKAQYVKYSECGVWRQALDEGTAVGGGLSFGYTMMIGKHFNIDLGAGGWGGRLLEQNVYHCPGDCYVLGRTSRSGPRNFLAINDITVALNWVF